MNPAETFTARDVMTTDVVSVIQDTPLVQVAEILAKHTFFALPVLSHDDILVGVVNVHDLIGKGSILHLPTLQYILQNLQKMPNLSQTQIQIEVEKIADLTAEYVMNPKPLTFVAEQPIKSVVDLFMQNKGVNTVPVINGEKKVLGIITRYDALRAFSSHPEKK